jgi:hypothetical protein
MDAKILDLIPDRLYFLTGDILANAVVGALCAGVCVLFIDTDWNMFVAMLVAMPIGMLLAMALAIFVFIPWFGAHEVMVPTMLGGMAANMFVSMGAAMREYSLWEALEHGAIIGVVALAFCSYANYLIRSVQRNP